GEVAAEGGANLGVCGQARLGWVERRAKASVETGTSIFPDVDQRMGGPRGTLAIDTYDYAFFPTRGYKIDAEIFDAQRVSGGPGTYGKGSVSFAGAWSVGDLIFVGDAEYGASTHGSLPITDQFALGGPRRLSGLAQNQVRGDEMTYGRLEMQYKLTRPIPILGFSVLAGIQA